MKNYGKFTVGLIFAWFLFALIGSALNLFKNDSERIGVAVALAAAIPILVFSLWFGGSKKFRQFALSLNPRLLTLAQSWRIVGFTFVLLEAKRMLPAVFALPAGYGDMFIGATATLAAWKLTDASHRSSFIFWQLLGITDLVTAVSLGTTAHAESAWSFHASHDRVAVKPRANISSAAVFNLSRDLHRTSLELEDCPGWRAKGESNDVPGHLMV
jgi:hypothetical protein